MTLRFHKVAFAWLGRSAGFWLLWSLLAGVSPASLGVGLITAVASAGLSLQLLPTRGGPSHWQWWRPLPGFLWQSLRGSVDVAWRALAPSRRVRPGWQRVPAPDDALGRYALGSEITLMPGTLMAGTSHDHYLVHLLDRDHAVTRLVWRERDRLQRAGWLPSAAGTTDEADR